MIGLTEKVLNLYEKYLEKYPNQNQEHFDALIGSPWYGFNMSEKEIIDVLEKCIKEDKIFQVWDLSHKEDPDNTRNDWWEGKLVFKKFKPIK
jgi:hypothetical protein